MSWRAVKEGFVDEDSITGNFGEVVIGKTQGRLSPEDKIFFNPIGLGIHDLSEAYRVFRNAKEQGIGQDLVYFNEPNSWLNELCL